MGYYTELKFNVKLKQDTPEDVVNILKRVINERDLGHDKVLFNTEDVFKPELNHPFFKCERWYMLFLSTNFDDEMQGGRFYEENGRWIINLHTEFKNYDNKIDNYLDQHRSPPGSAISDGIESQSGHNGQDHNINYTQHHPPEIDGNVLYGEKFHK